MADEPKIIFTMSRVSKAHEKKPIIKDISLSFYHGAKIGVLGINGSGKSTVLRIIAGVDKQYEGEIHRVPGYTVGYLEQELKLDPDKTVKEFVEEAVSELKAIMEEYDDTFVKIGETDDADDQEKI